MSTPPLGDGPFNEITLHVRVDLPAGLGTLSEARRIEANPVIPLETLDPRIAGADLREKLDEAVRAVLLEFDRVTGDDRREPEGTRAE